MQNKILIILTTVFASIVSSRILQQCCLDLLSQDLTTWDELAGALAGRHRDCNGASVGRRERQETAKESAVEGRERKT